FADELLDLAEDGDAVNAMMGRQIHVELVVQDAESPCLPKPPTPDAAGDRRRVHVGAEIGIRELVHDLEAPFGPRPTKVELASCERDDAARTPGLRPKLGIPDLLRNERRLPR